MSDYPGLSREREPTRDISPLRVEKNSLLVKGEDEFPGLSSNPSVMSDDYWRDTAPTEGVKNLEIGA
jgi:hypothetical protein